MGFGVGERRLLRSHEKFGQRKVTLSRLKPREFFLEGEDFKPGPRTELEVDSKEASRSASTSGSVERSRKDTLQLFDVTTRDARNGELIGGARLMVLAL